ncbi:MAG: Hsp20/alpha crystallin family protein [Planctomycetota bacterium]
MTSLIPWRRSSERALRDPATFPLAQLRWDFDRVFDRFFGGFGIDEPGLDFSSADVRMDVTEDDERILVRAEVPGIEAKDLDITLTGDVLTLSGEKRDERSAQDGDRTWSERRFGSFRRSIPLSCAVDPDSVTAEYANGVLTVALVKAEGVRPRRIEVKGA